MKLHIPLRTFTLLAAVILCVSGCQPGQKTDTETPIIRSPQQVTAEILGYSVQQRPIELLTMGDGGEVILIIATIHGNEIAGTPLVYKLVDVLKQRPHLLASRTILIVPVANPDGMALGVRGNAMGIDLNRNFPAPNRINNEKHGQMGLTEPESQILHNLIVGYNPVRILSLHQPLICLDYDGPGESIARRMAMYCNLPVKKLGTRPGSLGSFIETELNIPIITMELKGSDSLLSAEELWAEYGPSVLAFIAYPALPYPASPWEM
jgi:protein MpaA